MRKTWPYVGGSVCVQPVSASPADVAMPATNARREIGLRVVMLFPPRHGAQLLAEARGNDHRNVNDEEQNQCGETEEVHGPSGLVAAKQIEEHGVSSRDRWRHREAGRDHDG